MNPFSLQRAQLMLVALAVFASQPAYSACGSAFCTVNTDWSSRGEWTEPGGRLDLRYEYIRQAQPRAGAESVGVGQVPGQEHDEVRTINRNYVVQFDYNFNERWGLSGIVPFVSRDHEHIHNDEATGEREPEAWHFNEFADARIYGRYQLQLHSEAPSSLGFALGLKLPTGPYDITNDQGEAAERMLQPGSGTTDALASVFYNRAVPGWGWIFTQARIEVALYSKDQYRPGNRYFVDLGYRYPITSKFSLEAQLNAVVKSHDYGNNAEPDESGAKYLFFTPGLSYTLTKALQVYAFVQLPLYQYVTGVQLTSDWAALAGASWRF
jgi:hypothetical protein